MSVLHFAQKLRELFKNSSEILSTKEVELNGITRQYLWILKNGNEIQMIFRGIYALNDVFEDKMYAISLRFKKAIFSHETALYIHNLTDCDPLLYTVTVPQYFLNIVQTDNRQEFTKRLSKTQNPSLTLFEKALIKHGILHKLIKPYTPRRNGKVERSHRKDNEYFYAIHTFYSFDDFKKQLTAHNKKYNHFPMRPLNWRSPYDLILSLSMVHCFNSFFVTHHCKFLIY